MYDGKRGEGEGGGINDFEGLLAATAAHSGFIAARMDITPHSAAALMPTGLLLLFILLPVLHATAALCSINEHLLQAHHIKKTFRTNINQLGLFEKEANQSLEKDVKTKCWIIPQNRGIDL